MTRESPPRGASHDIRDDVEDKDSGGTRRAYDPERYPPVSVAVLQLLPGSSARAFAIAVAEGRWLDGNGSFDRLRSGKDAAGSLITPERLPSVLEATMITLRTFQGYVNEWEYDYLAHRCKRGTVCLFTRRMPDACPACRDEITYDHLPHGLEARHHSTTKRGDTAVQARHHSSSELPKRGVTALPEHVSATPTPRGLLGLEVGSPGSVPSDEAVDLPEVAPREEVAEIAVPFEWRPSPFEDKRCPECRCWPHQGGHFAGCPRRTIREASA